MTLCKLSSGKLATIDGKPFHITQEEFEDCCCKEPSPYPPVQCPYCDDSLAPGAFLVVIAGVQNADCTECGSMNGSFILDYAGPGPGQFCGYNYEGPHSASVTIPTGAT